MVRPRQGRAAIYTRISKDREGAELGVDRQEQDCRALAERLNLGVVDIFRDNDTSASTLSQRRRAGYEDMMSRARTGEFDTILTYSNSRLTRRPREYEALIDLHQQHGVAIRTVVSGDHDLSTADGRAVARTIAAWDAAEAERTGERIKRQKRQRAETGEWHGGIAPFGYEAKGKRLIPQPDEAARVMEAATRLVNDREALHSIVADWNARGVTTRSGKHWRQTNLRSILMNRSSLGETKAGVVGWEPILDVRTFDRLQALFSDGRRKVTHSPGVKGGKYSMGGGLTVCGRCGKPLTSQLRGGTGAVSLLCNKQVQGPHPAHPSAERTVRGQAVLQDTGRVRIDHAALEAHVFERVLNLLNATPRWQQRLSEQDPNVDAKLDALEAERQGLRDQRERAGKAFVVGVMSERDAQREVARIDVELAELEGEASDLLGRPNLSAFFDGDMNWAAWTASRRRAALRLLIDRVVVNDYPNGRPRNVARSRGESDEALRDRRRALQRQAVADRVTIVWKWEA